MKTWMKYMIVIFIIISPVVIFSRKEETPAIYDASVKESMLAVNFTIRRNEIYNGEGDFDLKENYTAQGIVDLFYEAGTNKRVKLVISLGRKKYIYDINKDNKYIYFPLQLGSGAYTIEIFENVKDDRFKKVYSRQAEVTIADDRLVYLNTTQITNWQMDFEPVSLASELILLEKIRQYEAAYGVYDDTSDLSLIRLSDLDKIEVIYAYVVTNIRYDFSKLTELTPDYLPDVRDVFNEKEGICYDYSALLATMLRSQNIPTKMIHGYTTTTDIYHAWNEVYVEDENRWIIIDTTLDSYLFERNKVYEMEKSKKDYTNSAEY